MSIVLAPIIFVTFQLLLVGGAPLFTDLFCEFTRNTPVYQLNNRFYSLLKGIHLIFETIWSVIYLVRLISRSFLHLQIPEKNCDT